VLYQLSLSQKRLFNAKIAQLPENRHEGALPTEFKSEKIIQCENSSVGRARPCQGRGRGFESRFSLSLRSHSCPDGGMVDTKDLKSFGLTAVRVQVPLRVRNGTSDINYHLSRFFMFLTV
jgi:hypothetical protein